MKHYSNLMISLGLLVLVSCRNNSIWPVKGKGPDETKTIAVGGFKKIHLAMDAEIYYTQDSIYLVEIAAQSNILKVIKTDVENDVLKINTGKTTILQHHRIRITIHSPDISEVEISGSGKLFTQNSIGTPSLKIKVSGNGAIQILSLSTPDADINVSGSGSVTISGGTAVRETIKISGSGTVHGVDLQSNQSTVQVSGSGNVSLWAIENLNVTISGSGEVSYKGSPVVASTVSGSGKLIHLN